MGYRDESEKIWEGFEKLKNSNRLQDTERDNLLFDLSKDWKFSEEKYSRVKEWMQQWCEYEGVHLTEIKWCRRHFDARYDEGDPTLYRFYFEPAFEDEEEMNEAMSKVFGFEVY